MGVEPTNGGFANRRQTPENNGKTGISETAGSASGNTCGGIPQDLQGIIDAWPALPNAIKAGILAMVRAATQ